MRTSFKYDTTGKISQAQFADGSTRVYRYDRLGLRRLRRLDGAAKVAYEYNPSGSMSKIVVTNEDGTTDGQQLALDEEQKVRTIDRLIGGKTHLTYDGMGNLTSMTREDGALRFSYDRYNRLTEVVRPDGKRLSYSYTDGEPDLRLQMDHHTGQAISGRMDSGLTFSSGLELLRNRTQGSLLGAVRFDRSMNDYRLASEFGVILPDTVQNNAIMRMRIIVMGETTYGYQMNFDAPSNVMFIPAEYWAVNCCPQVCPPRTEGVGVKPSAITCPPCEPVPVAGEIVELYYKYSTDRNYVGPDNTPMKECIYNNCPSNTGKRCYSDAGHSEFILRASPCPTGILLVSEYKGSFFGIITQCKIINHQHFFGPFTCP
jgi:YD repeat-containing protein